MMNFDKANMWLTLVANIAVLAGIVFLSMEISQSNRIAVQDARSELTSKQHDLELLFLENSDVAGIMVKLAAGDELTPHEEFQATSFAMIIINEAAALNLTYENEFISDRVLQRYLRVQSAMLDRVPGIAPFLAQAMESIGLSQRGISPVFDNLMDAIDKHQ